MVLSNAERQKLHRERRKSAITPEDVRRAARIIYDDFRESDPNAPSFVDFVASLTGRRRSLWEQWPPTTRDLDAIGDGDFSPDDLALLRRVAAVVDAVKIPPLDGE